MATDFTREKIFVAGRVISAYSIDRVHPNDLDVQLLKGWAESSEERNLPPDELACVIIRRESARLRALTANAG